jgi:hypothetical protein
MTKTGKTNTGDLWWALKAVEPPPVPHPAPLEPSALIDHVAADLSTAVATMIHVAEGCAWEVKVTRAVGTVVHKTGKPGGLVESFALRMRGLWEPVDHDRWGTASRRAAVAVFHRKMGDKPDVSATFHDAWWWRVDHQDHALTVPLETKSTALIRWIRLAEEPPRLEPEA